MVKVDLGSHLSIGPQVTNDTDHFFFLDKCHGCQPLSDSLVKLDHHFSFTNKIKCPLACYMYYQMRVSHYSVGFTDVFGGVLFLLKNITRNILDKIVRLLCRQA